MLMYDIHDGQYKTDFKKKICGYCGEKFDSCEEIPVDCGVTIQVMDHGTYKCPDAKDRIPWEYSKVKVFSRNGKMTQEFKDYLLNE